jgi:putative ABC transport system permease protein
VDVGYFDAMRIALLRGRVFTDADRAGSQPVAVINDTMARRYWPDEDAVGRRFRLYGFDDYLEVVGVVETVKYQSVGEAPQPCIFLPIAQNYVDAANLYVRTAAAPTSVIGAVRAAVRDVDAEMPIPNVFTVGEIIDQSLWAAKMTAGLLAVFGVLALVLSSVGLYGILAYSVTRRQREIGLRMALGAAGGDVLRLVLRQGLTLVAVGVVIGLAGAAAVSRALASLLYGSPTDLASFGGSAIALVAVATVATLVPALRASRVDPLVALREG